MKKTRILFGLVAFCLFMIWFYPYAKYELLTWKYGNEFIGLQKSTNMIDEIDFLKVIDYSNDLAEVYYVKVEESGNILSFENNNGVWKMKEWNTVWSKSGSQMTIYGHIFTILMRA